MSFSNAESIKIFISYSHDSPEHLERVLRLSDRLRRDLFLFALERGFQDSVLERVLVEPFMRLARVLTRLDAWLCGAVLSMPRDMTADATGDQDE